MIPISECIKGHVYKVKARNFRVAVFDGKVGFTGIRTKFGQRFLDTELHWDADETHGTCRPLEPIESLPDGLRLEAGWWEGNEYKHNIDLFNYMEAIFGTKPPSTLELEGE